MAFIADFLSWAFIISGSIFLLIGGIGMLRLPDVFTRMHGAGIIDTAGIGFILLGLMFQAGFTIVTIKLILIIAFVLYTGPTATHALARAILNDGVKPQVAPPEPRKKKTEEGVQSKT